MSTAPPFLPSEEEKTLISEGWRPQYFETTREWIVVPPQVPLEFIPHPQAPLFNNGDENTNTIVDLIKEITSENANLNDEAKNLLRQASFVSLFFFLKYVAGAYGPYSDLSDHLHVEVANFRQRMLHAGARGAVFLPRSFYKSTVCTHGADGWELLRDPNLRIGLIASNSDMAEQFMSPVKALFEENPLIEYLFPEYVPAKGEAGNIIQPKWNSKIITMPNRTLSMNEPSIKTMGAGGSVAGNHFDLLNVDDLVSEKELDSTHTASADMQKKSQWFSMNQDTLLISPKTSRVFLAATRYAVNDPYEQIFGEIKTKYGYWDELPYEVNKEIGIWDVYYRMAIERDRYVFPEKVGKIELNRIKKKDPWAYHTQYLNNPYSAAAAEFVNYPVKECELDYNEFEGMSVNFLVGDGDGVHNEKVLLGDCEVTIGIDPAASERSSSNTSKTSRSAIIVRARDSEDRRFYIDGAVGYFSPTELYDHIFRLAGKYKAYLRATNFEAQGAFKFVYNTLVEMQKDFSKPRLKLRNIPALQDKDGKIRNFIQPLLEFSKVYVSRTIRDPIEEELSIFPGGLKRDTLDAMELADRFSIKPRVTENEDAYYKKLKERRIGRSSNAAGY